MSDFLTAPATAFAGVRCIRSGSLVEAALAAKSAVDGGEAQPVLVFDDATGAVVELDLRGTTADLVAWLADRAREAPPVASAPARERSHRAPNPPPGGGSLALPSEEAARRGRGRPKLGVVAREVTLLPRHWEWLDGQPGTASQTLRRLVEEARRDDGGRTAARRRTEAAYRFVSTLAGDLPQFEESLRALFAGDRAQFLAVTGAWPRDVAGHAVRLAWPASESLEEGSE